MANRQVSYVNYVYVLLLRRCMDTIKRRIAGKVRSYEVYTKDEANKLGYAYIDWRHADEGDLAVSDDGYVSDCISKNIYTDKKGRTTSESTKTEIVSVIHLVSLFSILKV